MALLVSGGGSNMAALADSMVGDHPARPVLVLSNTPKAGGLAKAATRGIPYDVIDHREFDTREAFDAVISARLKEAGVEVICLAGFMRIFSSDFTEEWAGRILNIHPSLLPKYPGLDTHARAIKAGDREAGCTVHLVTADLDAGPILGQARVPVYESDTKETLAARVLAAEHTLYPQVLRNFVNGSLAPLYLP